MLLEGHWICHLDPVLDQGCFAQVQVATGKWCSHLSSRFLALSCSAPGHSSRPWRFNASRIHPFYKPWVNQPAPSIGRPPGVLICRSDLANHGLGRVFYRVDNQVSEADWYSRGPRVQFPIGSSCNHRGRQLGASCWFSKHVDLHAVSPDTCVAMEANSPK